MNTKILRQKQRVLIIKRHSKQLAVVRKKIPLDNIMGWRIFKDHKLAHTIVKEAREEIYYSYFTVDWDILCAMFKAYKKFLAIKK